MFIPSASFQGARHGYAFKLTHGRLGYHVDHVSSSLVAVALGRLSLTCRALLAQTAPHAATMLLRKSMVKLAVPTSFGDTAKLFEAASQLGAILAKQPDSVEKAMSDYGMHLGTAFQLIDDIMDYSASAAEMGKNVGDDLAEGKPTLPLIIALQRSEGDDAKMIRDAIENGGLENITPVMAIIEKTKALDYAYGVAKKETDLAVTALNHLPDSPEKTALTELAWFSIQRKH